MDEETLRKKKALFLYSSATGKAKKKKQLDYILPRLEAIFNLTVHQDSSMEEGIKLAIEACGHYDVLILFGGDGSLNHITSCLVGKENAPVFAYIPGGTLNDGGKNFGAKNIKKAIEVIEKGHVDEIDMVKAGDDYCIYLAGIGAYMNVSYVASRSAKKAFGHLIYYLICMKEMFYLHRHKVSITCENGSYTEKAATVAFLNGKWLGGMKVNAKGKLNDGEIEMLLVRPRLFNGFLSFLLKAGFVRLKGKRFSVTLDPDTEWCLDGEKGKKGSLDIEVIPKAIRCYCDPDLL